jgi:hypothetical protein
MCIMKLDEVRIASVAATDARHRIIPADRLRFLTVTRTFCTDLANLLVSFEAETAPLATRGVAAHRIPIHEMPHRVG